MLLSSASPLHHNTLTASNSFSIDRSLTKKDYGIGCPFDSVKGPILHSLQRKGQRSQRPTAVVVGAGPGGLASALVLAKKGWDIVCVDKRSEYSRYNMVALREDTHQFLRSLGVDVTASDFTGNKLENIRINNDQGLTLIPVEHEKLKIDRLEWGDRGQAKMKESAESLATITVPIRELERALCQKVKEAGVKIISGATVKLEQRDQSSKRLHAEMESADSMKGDSFDLGYPDLVISADGKNSQGKFDRGIETQIDARGHTHIAAICESASEANVCYFANEQGNIDFTMSHTEEGVTWGCFQTPADDPKFEKRDPTDFIKKKMAQVGGVDGLIKYASKPFIMNHQRSTKYIDGYNHILVGDSAGNATAQAGVGANKAVYWDARNVQNLADDLSAPKVSGKHRRREALRRFSEAADESVEAWQSNDRSVFEMILGPEGAHKALKV